MEKCHFCGKGFSKAGRLIRPPDSDIYICRPCALGLFSLDYDGCSEEHQDAAGECMDNTGNGISVKEDARRKAADKKFQEGDSING